MNALRKDINAKSVRWVDFEDAFKKVKPSVTSDTANKYKKLEEYYLRKAKAGIELGPIYTG